MCVREQHRSNSPTSGLCWPSSALDTGCFGRDRPHPLSPLSGALSVRGRKHIHLEKKKRQSPAALTSITSVTSDPSGSLSEHHWSPGASPQLTRIPLTEWQWLCLHAGGRASEVHGCHMKCVVQLSVSLRSKAPNWICKKITVTLKPSDAGQLFVFFSFSLT